jgi:hypothetical protein
VADYVVDTNVWAMVDKDIASLTADEIACFGQCKNWLRAFVAGDDKLVVDTQFLVFSEYRNNIGQNGLARVWLNQLETKPRNRKLVELEIELNEEGFAVVPPHCEIHDKQDRKWVALALKDEPPYPIVNAVDTDWEQEKELLNAANIYVQELCLTYIQTTLNRR